MRHNLFSSQTFWRFTAALTIFIALAFGVMPLDPLTIGGGLMVLATTPFPVTPQLTAVAIAYRNGRLIADEVLPRVIVPDRSFKYLVYPKGVFLTVPDTKVGRKSQPGRVELSATETTDSVDDFGLDDAVPNDDIAAAQTQPNLPDPLLKSAEYVTDLVLLAREKRVADLVFNAANYAAGNKVTLSGTGQWSDFVNSDPVSAILAALDSCIMRPNVLAIGRAAWTKLSTHPKICKAVFGQNTDAGVASRQQVAALFELDDVLVGESWINTAKKGQTATPVRVWGKHAVFAYRNKNADTQRGATYGLTAQWGGRVAGSEYDKNIGLRGGQIVRVGESVKELLCANDLAYMFENAVA